MVLICSFEETYNKQYLVVSYQIDYFYMVVKTTNRITILKSYKPMASFHKVITFQVQICSEFALFPMVGAIESLYIGA